MEKKKLSERSSSELIKIRLFSATTVAALVIVIEYFIKQRFNIFEVVMFGVLSWILWFFLFHKLVIWLEKVFLK